MTPVPAKKYKLMKIIIADDSSLWRDRIKSLLESINNVHVEGEAENGVEALQLIRKIEPDLAILDIRMPEMNGIEVLKKIREMGLQTKVCILTNYPYKQYKERCIAAGTDYFIDKNLDIQQLLDIIFKLANNYERA
jgi:DNA-binding NarL/FixJ family response regulator